MVERVRYPIEPIDVESLSACPICGESGFETIVEVYRGQLNFLNAVFCMRCGFVFRQMRPRIEWFKRSWEKRTNEEDTGSQYDEGAALEKRRFIRYERLARFAEGILKGRRMLDVGCGPGTGLKAFRDRGWDVTGLEPDPSRARVGRKRHGLNILESTIEDYRGGEGAFDLITLIHVLEHFHSPVDFLSHVVRHLSDEGYLYIEVPDAARFISWRDSLNLEHMNNFSRFTMQLLLGKLGLVPEYWASPRTAPFGVCHLGVFCRKSADTACGSMMSKPVEVDPLLAEFRRLYRKGLPFVNAGVVRYCIDDIIDIAGTVDSGHFPYFDSAKCCLVLRGGKHKFDIIRYNFYALKGLSFGELALKLLSRLHFNIIKDTSFEMLKVFDARQHNDKSG